LCIWNWRNDIDNGFGAAILAGQILRTAHKLNAKTEKQHNPAESSHVALADDNGNGKPA
jgi:hypothetical protein